MAPRKVTVFGGTGFLGQRVVQRLLERDFSVRVAVRHPERIAALFPALHPDAIQADVNDDRSVAAAVAGVEGVVNAASLYAESGSQTVPFTSKPQHGSPGLREKRGSAGSSTCPALARMPNPSRRTSAAAGRRKGCSRGFSRHDAYPPLHHVRARRRLTHPDSENVASSPSLPPIRTRSDAAATRLCRGRC